MSNSNIGEARGIAWTNVMGEWRDASGGLRRVTINLTARADSAEEALRELIAALKVARDEYKLYPGTEVESIPATKPTQAEDVAPSATPTQDKSAQGVNEMIITRIAIVPRSDGKSKVEMYSEGHKYPDLTIVMNPESLVKMFADSGMNLDENIFRRAAEKDMKFVAIWRNSERLNSKGNPYRDVVAIKRVA